jgi:outer membrane protein assembly factor BamE (lipoprotein component of BamABCDE complex)
MNKIIIFLTILFFSNCTINKVVKHHGVHFLEKKQENFILKKTNRNEIFDKLGPPSTKSTFNNDVWIYIERKTTKSNLVTLGKKKLLVNNVLVLEIDNRGLLIKKDFYNKRDMKKIKFTSKKSTVNVTKDSFVYSFLSSMRQKVNDPIGKRKKRSNSR